MGPSRLRNSTPAAKARSVQKSRRKPAPPKPSKHRAESHPSPQATAAPESVPITALREIRKHLIPILSCVIVVEHALLRQNAELDDDAARVLRVHVGDPLQEQTEIIGRLLGEEEEEDDDEDEGGAL